MAAQAQVDSALIFSGKARLVDGKLVAQTSISDDLPSLMEIKQQQENENLHRCVQEALKDTLSRSKDNAEGDKEPLSDHFFSRWRAEAIHISGDEEQQIWGKILSEEAEKKGSFSLRTLDILRNLERKNALDFIAMYGYIVNGKTLLISVGGSEPIAKGINYPAISSLSNLGILSDTIMADVQTPEHEIIHFDIDKYRVCILTKKTLKVELCNLTTSGIELYRIIDPANRNTVITFCNDLLNSNGLNGINEIHFYDKTNPQVQGGKIVTETIKKGP